MKKTIFALMISLVAALSMGAYLKHHKPTPTLPKLGKVSDFRLNDQTAKPTSLATLTGKVWIASFIFTRCQGPCPLMSQKAAYLQKQLAGEKRLRILSITMDPEYDSPAVLAAYGEKFNANPERWLLLTGEKADIISLAITAFKLPASENPNLHSTRFVLVDQQAQIRGYYDSQDPQAIEKLIRDAKTLAAEVGNPAVAAVATKA